MADSSVALTAGTGTLINTRTDSNGQHRQVVVLGAADSDGVNTLRANGEIAVGYGRTTITGTISALDSASTQVASWVGGIPTYIGTPTANSAVTLAVDGQAAFTLQVTGGTHNLVPSFEKSMDGGTTWVPAAMWSLGGTTSVTVASTLYTAMDNAAGRGAWIGDCTGATHVRARCTEYTSGSVTVLLTATGAGGPTLVYNTAPPPRPYAGTSATRINVTAATTSTTLSVSSPAKLAVTVFNDSTAILYLGMGSNTVSASSHTVQVAAGGYWESPINFSGDMKGIWAAANGAARVTEIY